jgi:hypothetical protein
LARKHDDCGLFGRPKRMTTKSVRIRYILL